MNEDGVYFFGKGGGKWGGEISDGNGDFIDEMGGLGKWMLGLGEKEMVREKFKDVGYFEGLYLKEFVGWKGKKVL